MLLLAPRMLMLEPLLLLLLLLAPRMLLLLLAGVGSTDLLLSLQCHLCILPTVRGLLLRYHQLFFSRNRYPRMIGSAPIARLLVSMARATAFRRPPRT